MLNKKKKAPALRTREQSVATKVVVGELTWGIREKQKKVRWYMHLCRLRKH